MLNEFEKTVAEFVFALGSFAGAKKVLLAVSGGADSTALLYAMHTLCAEGILKVDFVCAHINHQLRIPDADLDQDFVVAQAANLSLPIITEKIDVRQFAEKKKLSVETAARILRIQRLQTIAQANGCAWIATAHQKNDNAETVVQRLLRGTGYRGLAGIRPLRNFSDNITFARPLLCVTRDQIIDYLKNRNLSWRTDRTNYDCRYKRNFIRHKLILHLQKDCADSLFETLHKLSISTQVFQNKVENLTDELWLRIVNISGSTIALDLQTFVNQPEPVQIELICRSLSGLGCGQGDLTEEHFEKILKLAGQDVSGKKITLPNGYRVWREYEDLMFSVAQSQIPTIAPDAVTLEIPGKTRFGDYLIEATVLSAAKNSIEEFKTTKTPFVEWFDFDKLQLPLKVRFRQPGDKFTPFGLASEKKVGKFLTLAKVPSQMRRELLIMADSQKIIWVCPIRICDTAKITTQTSKILQLQIHPVSLSQSKSPRVYPVGLP